MLLKGLGKKRLNSYRADIGHPFTTGILDFSVKVSGEKIKHEKSPSPPKPLLLFLVQVLF